MALSNLLARQAISRMKCVVPPARKYSCLMRDMNNCSKVLTSSFKVTQSNTFSVSPVRKSESGSHVGVWMGERVLGLGLAFALPLSVIAPNPVLDYSVVAMMVVHAHWGLEAIAVDYVRKAIFGPFIPKVALFSVYALSMIAMGGLFYFNYTDVGFGNAVRMLWKI